jgi:hypothetical protein
MKDVHCIIIQFITQCGYWDPERIMNKERAETQSENLRTT